MSYRDRLSPWCLTRQLPQMQRTVIGRFRKRNDASEHLKVLQRWNPSTHYEIVFDPVVDDDPDDYQQPELELIENDPVLSPKLEPQYRE